MMSIGILNSLIARAHGVISRFLTKDQLYQLLSAKDLLQLKAAFMQTNYSHIVEDFNFETQLSEVARAFKKDYANLLLSFYRQAASIDVRKKISQFTERYHVENIRIILHGKFVETPEERILERIVEVPGYSMQYYEQIIKDSIEGIIKKQQKKFKKILVEGYKEFQETQSFVSIESSIDQFIYSSLLEISPYYEVYVNMRNIIALCRALVLGVSPYRYLLPSKFISQALDKKNVREVLETYNYGVYRKVFAKFLDEKEIPIDKLEFEVEKYQTNVWKKVFRKSSGGSYDSLIAFFELKLAETMDLIRIIVGINAGLSKEDIIETLTFYIY